RLQADVPAALPSAALTRIPLLAGSRIAVVSTGEDAVVLAPPPPREHVADVAAAVRDSLRFPLTGEPLEAAVPRRRRCAAVVDPHLVLAVSAAETVLHGGPSLLIGSSDPATIRAAGATSLLETAASQGWRLGVTLERALSHRVAIVGTSLVQTHPRLTGLLKG